MGERPERWSSTMSGQRLYNDNYKFQLTISPSSSLAWSRFRWAITRSFDGNSRLQPVDTLSPVHFQPYNSPSSVQIKIFVLDEKACHVLRKNLIPFSFFCTYSSGLVTLAMPGLSCWGVVVSVSRSERVISMRNCPLTVLQGRPCLENRREDIGDSG